MIATKKRVKMLSRCVCKDRWENRPDGHEELLPVETMARRVVCRACLKAIKKGEQAIPLYHHFADDATPYWMQTRVYIHPKPCVDISERGLDLDYRM